jgi:hypothetical protein
LRGHLLGWNGYSAQVAVRRRILKGGRTLLALQQKLYAAQPALDLTDARDNAHRVQDVRRRLLGVVALSDGEHKAVAFKGRLDRTEG